VKNQLVKLVVTGGSCILIVFTSVVYFAKTMDRDPDLAFAYIFQGVVRSELMDDRQGAIDSYDRAIQLQPDRADTYYLRGKTRYKLNNTQGAIDDFDRVIKFQPDYINAYISRGVIRATLDDKKAAIDDFRKAAELYKKVGKIDLSENLLDRANKLSQ
jgi:tetratricopeptide (TPR) repeat protein